MKCSQPARHHTKSQTFKLNDRPLQLVFTTLAITPLLRQLDTPFYHGFTIFASFRCSVASHTPSLHHRTPGSKLSVLLRNNQIINPAGLLRNMTIQELTRFPFKTDANIQAPGYSRVFFATLISHGSSDSTKTFSISSVHFSTVRISISGFRTIASFL